MDYARQSAIIRRFIYYINVLKSRIRNSPFFSPALYDIPILLEPEYKDDKTEYSDTDLEYSSSEEDEEFSDSKTIGSDG